MSRSFRVAGRVRKRRLLQGATRAVAAKLFQDPAFAPPAGAELGQVAGG